MLTLDQILNTQSYAELFPEGTKKEYRQLLKLTHPDLYPGEEDKAQKAFVHVNLIWQNKTQTPQPGTVKTEKPSSPTNTIYSKRYEYVVTVDNTVRNGVAYYEAQTQSVHHTLHLLTATNEAASKRLLNGAGILKNLRAEVEDQYLEFYPKPLDAFHHKVNNQKRFATVLDYGENKWYTLQDVKNRYPLGIPGEDYAWMARRVYVALGLAHDNGYALTAPTLNSFHIQPETHGLKLVEWQYATKLGEKATALPSADLKRHYTVNETSIKKDLKIASEALYSLLGRAVAKPVRMFARGMTIAPTATARDALIELEEVLFDVYGERKFHKFTI